MLERIREHYKATDNRVDKENYKQIGKMILQQLSLISPQGTIAKSGIVTKYRPLDIAKLIATFVLEGNI